MRARARDLAVTIGPIEHTHELWYDPFDVVTLCDVLEHLPAPLEALRKIRNWMKPDATLLVRGPLNNDPLTWVKESARRVVGATKKLKGYPLDANVFNPKSLTAVLLLAGFSAPEWRGQAKGFANALAIAR
jgi:SAM-dependent methyltransferase